MAVFVLSRVNPRHSVSIHKDAMEIGMAFIPVTDAAQVETVFTMRGQICENVYHVQKAGGFTEADLAGLTVVFSNWWTTSMRALHGDSVTLTKVKARDITVSTGPGVELGVSASNVGTAVGSLMPNNAAVAIKFTTGFSGRSFRARIYHMGLVDSQLVVADHNKLLAATVSALVTGYTALKTACTTNSTPLCVASRYHNKAPRSPGIATIITGISVDDTLDSQRRRLPGRGR